MTKEQILIMGASPKSLAKLNPPKLTNVYYRKRLFDLLDNARSSSIIWLNSVAGSGKTTLVASYLENSQLNASWYHMDQGDADPASFFYYLSLAAKKNSTRRKNQLPVLRPEYLNGLDRFARNYFRDLFSRLKKPGLLIIDNYQDCPADSSLHQALAVGFEEIPEGSNILVVSREDPPPAFARLRASGSFYMFNPKELSLTLNECEQVCKSRLGPNKQEAVEFNPEQLAKAHELTQGWVTGLILMLDQLQEQCLPDDLDPGENQTVFDYFAGEIFSNTDENLQKFLLKTALLPIMTPAIAEQISGFQRAARLFNTLSRKNYFIIKHSSSQSIYQYHPLFREFLRDHARNFLGPYEIIEIQRTGAQLLAETGHLEAAVELFTNIKDWHAIAKLVSDQSAALIGAGRHKTINEWLKKIPDTVIRKTPWLQFWLGVSSQPFNMQLSRKYFIQAYEQFKNDDLIEGMLHAWVGIVESYIIEWGNFKPLDHWISEMEVFLARNIEIPTTELEQKVAAGMFSALMYRQPDNPQLEFWEKQLHDAIGKIKNSYTQMKMGFQLFFYYTVWVGDLPKASVIAKLLKPGKDQTLEPITHTLWFALEGIYLWKTGENKACLKAIEKGLALAEQSGFLIWRNLLYSGGVYASLSLEEEEQAQHYLARMAETLDPNRLYDVTHYHYIVGRIHLHRGKFHEALEHCEAGLKAATDSGSPYAEALIRTIHAQALFQRKAREKAVAVNHIVRDLATRMRARNMLFIALMSEAEFSFEMNSISKACKALKQALLIADEQKLIKHAFWWPPIMARLCVKALEYDIETDYVQKVVRTRRLIPDAPPLHLDNWPWAVKIYTLGRFSLLVNGKTLANSGSARKKPLELLKAIISLGGREIDQHKITDMLWPDSEGDSATQNLHTTIHRLRKLLGEEAVILHNGYVSLNDRYAWVDTWSFERLIGQISKILRLVQSKENIEQVSSLSSQLFSLYQGNFLANESEKIWSVAIQQKLKSRFIRLIIDLGSYWQKSNDWERAISCYRHGLEIDNLAEELYQHIMHAYQKTDRQADAIAIYKQCQKNLFDFLGTSPSPKTESLFKNMHSE